MARMLLLEQGNGSTTYATIDNDGMLTIEERYLNSDGSLDFSRSVVVLAGGVQKLLELLSIMQPNNGLQSDGARVCVNCGQPRSKHQGRGKFFCPGRPTAYA